MLYALLVIMYTLLLLLINHCPICQLYLTKKILLLKSTRLFAPPCFIRLTSVCHLICYHVWLALCPCTCFTACCTTVARNYELYQRVRVLEAMSCRVSSCVYSQIELPRLSLLRLMPQPNRHSSIPFDEER